MTKLFDPNSPAMRFLSRVADLVILNLVYLVCCIPVITIGSATAAMYQVTRMISMKDKPPILRTYFSEFKTNFKKGFFVELILLIPIALVASYFALMAAGGMQQLGLRYLSYLALVIVAVIITYVFPLMACFENTLGNTFKNAFILPFANPFLALLTTVINFLPLIMVFVNFELLLKCGYFWLVIGFSLASLVNNKMLESLFRKVAPEDFARMDEERRKAEQNRD